MTFEHMSMFFRFAGRTLDEVKNPMTEAMDKASQEGWEVWQVSQTTAAFWFTVLVVFRRPRA